MLTHMLTPCILLSCLLSSIAGNSRLVTSCGLCSTLTHACTACSLHRAIPVLLPHSELPADFRHWLLEQKIPVFYKFWPQPTNKSRSVWQPNCISIILKLCLRCYVLFYLQLYLNCIFTYVLISFSHGYSATLAAKLIIKLDLSNIGQRLLP